MSYRSSDAYSRRPTGDDRRVSDSRDRRRESLPKGGSDSYKDDRYRRDIDASARDARRNPAESPRELVNPTAKFHGTVNSSRSENGIRTRSASQSPAESPGLSSTSSKKLVSLLQQYGIAIIEVARLRAERDPLEKVWKQRQEDYEKSKIKHAEFPSVPEVQNLHRVKYAERVRCLEAEIQKAQEIVDNTIRSIALAVSSLSEPDAPPQQQEMPRKQQAEINELKAELRKIKAERSQEQSDIKAEFESRCAQLKEQMEETVKGLKDEKEVEAIKRFREETAGEVKQQLRVMRQELDERQSNRPEAVSIAQVSTLIQEEKLVLQSDISALMKRVDGLAAQNAQDAASLRNDWAARTRQMDELAALRAADTVSLRNDLTACVQRVDSESRKIEEHEEKLSSLDTEGLENVAETMSINFPALQRKVAGIQAKVDGVISHQEVEDKQNHLFARVQNFVVKSSETLGGMVDEVQKGAAGHEARIKALEQASTNAPGLGAETRPSQAAKAEFEIINSDIALIKSEFDATKVTVDKLSQHVSTIVSDDLKNQLETLRLSITVLDSQFNNLSTKSLAEHIVGQLGQIYPNAPQLTADIEGLKIMISNLASRIDGVEERVEKFERAGSEACGCRAHTCASEAKSFDMSKVSDLQNCMLGTLDESDRPSVKRRRLNSGANGNGVEGHLMTNGAD